jgi:hypothetical protein
MGKACSREAVQHRILAEGRVVLSEPAVWQAATALFQGKPRFEDRHLSSNNLDVGNVQCGDYQAAQLAQG